MSETWDNLIKIIGGVSHNVSNSKKTLKETRHTTVIRPNLFIYMRNKIYFLYVIALKVSKGFSS